MKGVFVIFIYKIAYYRECCLFYKITISDSMYLALGKNKCSINFDSSIDSKINYISFDKIYDNCAFFIPFIDF